MPPKFQELSNDRNKTQHLHKYWLQSAQVTVHKSDKMFTRLCVIKEPTIVFVLESGVLEQPFKHDLNKSLATPAITVDI